MPTLKKDPQVMRRHFKNLLVLGIPFVATLGGGMLLMEKSPPIGVGFWLAGFAIAVVGLVRQERNFRRYACPTCGQALRRETGKPGERISFVCLPCDTEWDTGFQESSS